MAKKKAAKQSAGAADAPPPTATELEPGPLEGLLPEAAAALVLERLRAFAETEGCNGVLAIFQRFDSDGKTNERAISGNVCVSVICFS